MKILSVSRLPNRQLVAQGGYTNLAQLKYLIRTEGYEIRVTDRVTGEDVTKSLLLKILQMHPPALLDSKKLHELLRLDPPLRLEKTEC